MSVGLYDDALTKKIKNWVKEGVVPTITSPNETAELFMTAVDTGNDKPIQLPLIAIRREPTITIKNISKRPLTFDSAHLEVSSDNLIKSLSAVPIDLRYKIDIYTRKLEQADEFLRNFVFNIINYPKLEIKIPYNQSNMVLSSSIHLIPEIEDNSDIPERLIKGQFTRFTIGIEVDSAYLYSVPIRHNLHIESNVETKFKDEI